MEERERLIEELSILKISQSVTDRNELGRYANKEQLGDIADFILQDRRRICNPLVKYKDWVGNNTEPRRNWMDSGAHSLSDSAIQETLTLAGIGEGKR